MLREYIKNIQVENDSKLGSLEREMQDLVSDLECNEKLLEKLQHERKHDTNIFSPRTIDNHFDKKMTDAQNKINEIKQRMEYVSQMVEEAMKQKNELHFLELEASKYECAEYNINQKKYQNIPPQNKHSDEITENKSDCSKDNVSRETLSKVDVSDSESKKTKLEIDLSEKIICESESEIDEIESKLDENENRINKSDLCIPDNSEQTYDSEIRSKYISSDDVKKILNTIYKKTEASLALVNGNKNRCKSELRSVLSLIREYAKKFENNDDI